MKTLKYLIAGLAVAFALAGCAGGSGVANFDDPQDFLYEKTITPESETTKM